MKDTLQHHIGFPDGAPVEVNFSDESFIRPVESSERRKLHHYEFSLLGIWGILTIAIIAVIVAVIVVKLDDIIFTPVPNFWGWILILCFCFWVLVGLFYQHILKIIFIFMVKSRPNRLFQPSRRCIFVGIEDSKTFNKLKVAPEVYGLISFKQGFLEIEMSNYRAKFSAKDISLSKHSVWAKTINSLKITCDSGPHPWNVTVTPYVQCLSNAFDLPFLGLNYRWLLKRINRGLLTGTT